MGCDIHMFAEVRKERTKRLYPKGTDKTTYTETTWEKVGKKFPNRYYDEDDFLRTGEDFYGKFIDQPYRNRNYYAFAFLNDVRNGDGMNIEPIQTNDWREDLPEGVSNEIKLEYLDWGEDAHSLRYFTLRELLNADWNQKVQCNGLVEPPQADEFVETKEPPKSYWGSGGNNEILLEDWLELDLPDRYEKNENDRYINSVRLRWTESILELCGDLYESVINLRKIADKEGVGLDDVRVIFWFDN